MTSLISLSAKVYRLLTLLYPDEIRRRWEAEMADTFALQIADALHEKRWTAMIAAWYYALAELLFIAVPRRLTRAALVIPVAALASAGAIFFGLLWALQNPLTLSAFYHHTFAKLGG
ncbi:MAG: hypothetical protein ABSH40_08690 [Bryobacteraceae bacterium]|jgi:hypothetical protein